MQIRWKFNSVKKLLIGSTRISGRNNSGKITHYHRGGGHKRLVRLIDYNRYIWNVFGFVHRLEYDPKRNALLALVVYCNGLMSYLIAPENLHVGDCILAKESVVFNPGNATFLSSIPVGVRINSVELFPTGGSRLVRAAGAFATIVAKSHNFAVVKLKSGELRRISSNCTATFGVVSNFQYSFRNFKKAGIYRLLGWRPVVRGVAMNPVDHPHGGGQGKTSGGRPSVTPWGVITKGKPTRLLRKSSFFIVKGRKQNNK